MKEKRHTSLGIASFILSLVAGAGMFVLVVLAGVLEGFTPGGLSEESMEAFLIGVVLICGLLLEVLSLDLGIEGLFQQAQSKTFPALGVAFSLAVLCGTISQVVIGGTIE